MINITLDEANLILAEMRNGTILGTSAGKNGRAWIEGEFQLCQLEALCVVVRNVAGNNAQGAEELIKYWKEDGML